MRSKEIKQAIDNLGPWVQRYEMEAQFTTKSKISGDSDGIQQETSILNISCLAIRDTSNIEYTIKYGTTQLCEPDRNEIFSKAIVKFHKEEKNNFSSELKELNDGRSSERISQIIKEYLK